MGSVPLDVALLGTLFHRLGEPHQLLGDKADKTKCAGKRVANERAVQLGALACMLLQLENGMVCITPVQPDAQLGSGNVRVREAGSLDFRGRRGQWAQFELQTKGSSAVFYHRATSTFLALAPSGELISSTAAHEFEGAAPPPFILMWIKNRNQTTIAEVARFMSEAEAHDALRKKEAAGVWCGFVAKEADGGRSLSLGSTSPKPIDGRTWTDVTLACCAANNIYAAPSAEHEAAIKIQAVQRGKAAREAEKPKFDVFVGADVFPGENAHVIGKVDTPDDLETCMRVCEERGFGTFFFTSIRPRRMPTACTDQKIYATTRLVETFPMPPLGIRCCSSGCR